MGKVIIGATMSLDWFMEPPVSGSGSVAKNRDVTGRNSDDRGGGDG